MGHEFFLACAYWLGDNLIIFSIIAVFMMMLLRNANKVRSELGTVAGLGPFFVSYSCVGSSNSITYHGSVLIVAVLVTEIIEIF